MSNQNPETPSSTSVRPNTPAPSDRAPISAAHRAELDRRLDALEKTPDAGRPWPEVRDALLRR